MKRKVHSKRNEKGSLLALKSPQSRFGSALKPIKPARTSNSTVTINLCFSYYSIVGQKNLGSYNCPILFGLSALATYDVIRQQAGDLVAPARQIDFRQLQADGGGELPEERGG